MANNTKILFEIDINTSQSIKQISEYQKAVERLAEKEKELRDKIREQGEATDEQRQQLVKITAQKRAYTAEIGKEQRQVQSTMRSQSELYANTLEGLRSELSLEKDKLRYLAMGSDAYQAQSDKVDELNERVKEAEYAFGVYARNVGNYGSALGGLTRSLKNVAMAGMFFSTSLGEESEKSEEAQKRTQSLMKALTAFIVLQKTSTMLTKNNTISQIANNLAKAVGLDTTTRAAKAEASAIALKSADTIATKGVTAATWLWNAALSVNPIFLLITAIAAVIAGVTALTKYLSSSAKAQKDYNNVMEYYNKLLDDSKQKGEEYTIELNQRTKAITERYAKEIEALKASGATAEKIADIKKQMENEIDQAEQEHLDKEIVRLRNEAALKEKQLVLAQIHLSTLKEGTKKYKEQAEAIKDLQSAVNEAQNALLKAETDKANNTIKAVEKEVDERISGANKAYDKQKEALDNLQKVEKAHLEARKRYSYDYTLSAVENAEREREHNKKMQVEEITFAQSQKKKLLELERKYSKITQEQYRAELEVLRIEYDAFVKEMEDNTKREQATLLESALKLAGGEMIKEQIDEIEKRYYDASLTILNDAKLAGEEKAYYLNKLEEKRLEEIKALNERYDSEIRKRSLSLVEEAYRYDVRLFSASEIEKTKAQIEQQQARIKALKEVGQTTIEEEAELNAMQIKLREQMYGQEMQASWNNKRKQAEIHKNYLQEVINDERLSIEERKSAEEELTEFMREEQLKRIEMMSEYANSTLDIMAEFNELLNTMGDAQVSKAEADNEAKKKDLDKQLKAGLISQKRYDREVAKADEELAEKQLKIKRKQAEQEKMINLFQVIINTATAIAKTAAMLGYPAAIPMIAVAAAMGAIQTATILAQPLPKAREGLIVGNTHEQGGVVINAEGGERIVAREPQRAFPELLNLISYIGKNGAIPDTGYAERVLSESVSVDSKQFATMIGASVADAIKDLNVSVSVEAIDNAKALQTRVENTAFM